MNDIMLYTYPQQDGKYRLKNTLSLSGMKASELCFFSNKGQLIMLGFMFQFLLLDCSYFPL